MSAVLAAAVRGCRTIILIEPQEARHALALQLGATHAVDPAAVCDVASAIRAIEPAGLDQAVEATGIPAVIETAVGAMGRLGTCALIGVPSKPGETAPLRLGLFLQNGVTLRGVIEGDSDPRVFIPELLALQARGNFPFERMISLYDFANINRAVANQKSGKCLKAVLRVP